MTNVLFVMCDQLRADYLSCYGAEHLSTPNIDALAQRGVRFSRAFVQSGVCGPSRMSFYTGRYPSSHGATWNFIPMPMSERTIGDFFAEQGRRFHLAGKTHFEPSAEAIALSAAGGSSGRTRSSLLQGGFDVLCRHEGDLPSGKDDYKKFLNDRGYAGDDPWLAFANSGRLDDGSLGSGWLMRHAHLAAAIDEPDSETAFVSSEAIDFIRRHRDETWALHLSYIKPHWPYIAPAPYHAMYRKQALPPPRRNRSSEQHEHPVVRAYRTHDESQSFDRLEVADHVKPAYMGLIKQIDDHLGRVLEVLDQTGQTDRTMIVFTSDHGDLLGDYGLGEKELFYDVVQRVPLIIVDPSAKASSTRGRIDDHLVQAVDVVPTLLDALGLPPHQHRVEGTSLMPLLWGEQASNWRDCVISELDYSTRRARKVLGLSEAANCRGWMVRTSEWKLVVWAGFRPQLFNLIDDPEEFHDLGADPQFESICQTLSKRLLSHQLSLKPRIEVGLERIERMTDNLPPGIFIGHW